MKPRLIRFDGFANIWYFEAGNICILNDQLLNSILLEDPNIEKIFVKPADLRSRNAYVIASGMTLNDLIEIPSTEDF